MKQDRPFAHAMHAFLSIAHRPFLLALVSGLGVFELTLNAQAPDAGAPVLSVPAPASIVAVDTPASRLGAGGQAFELIDPARSARFPVSLLSTPSPAGTPASDLRRLVSQLPSRAGDPARYRLERCEDPAVRPPLFQWKAVDDRSLGLWEGDRPVLVYNHGVMSKPGVPAHRNRSTYIHPLYGLDGEVLTDDFPVDHYHHRGLFWAWPHVKVGEREYDLWTIQGMHQRFERWLAQEVQGRNALLAVENGWYAGDRKVLTERVWILCHPAEPSGRCIDLEFFWIPLEGPFSLAGAEGKSYGGLTLRYAPRTGTVITTPLGRGPDDLEMTALPWADLSADFTPAAQAAGIALFIHPRHPDYPPTWLTRHYGALCIGWPGVEARTFPINEPIHCRYRVWIHRDKPAQEVVAAAYATYEAETRVAWE